VDSQSPGNPDGIDAYVHFFHNQGWQELESRVSSNENTEPESLQPQYQYVWSQRYIDAPILRDKNTDTDGLCDDERLYYLGDANFNITTLVDTSGDALERYVYTPYGVPTIYDATWSNVRSTSTYSNSYTYTGRQLDAETGLYLYRQRTYHGQLGRFLARDPIGYQGVRNLLPSRAIPAHRNRLAGLFELSVYRYVQNMPVNLVDPSGLDGSCTCTKPVGRVAPGGGICGVTMLDTDGSPMPDNGLGTFIDRALVTIGAGSQTDVLNGIDRDCCTLYLIGHRGGEAHEGGIVTYPPGGRVEILPDPDFETKLRNKFAHNGCIECVINIVSCGDYDHPIWGPIGSQRRKDMANQTGCTVCGSKHSTHIHRPILNPCAPGAWEYTCEKPG
jgi:RHS repeat-associated protein